jgi:hypothetical protein
MYAFSYNWKLAQRFLSSQLQEFHKGDTRSCNYKTIVKLIDYLGCRFARIIYLYQLRNVGIDQAGLNTLMSIIAGVPGSKLPPGS